MVLASKWIVRCGKGKGAVQPYWYSSCSNALELRGIQLRFIFSLCDRVAVLVQGQKLTEGSPDLVQSDPRVIAAYLGTPA